MAGLRPVDEPLVVTAGKEEGPGFGILELLEQRVGQFLGELEVEGIEFGLHQLDQRIDEECVIVEIGVEVRTAVLAGGKQAAVLPHPGADERERALGGLHPFRLAEDAAGARHAADHQRVPGHEDLLVAPRADALFARGERLGARRSKQPLIRGFAHHREVPVLVLEVGLRIEAIVALEHRVLLRRQQVFKLVLVPDVVLAFHALRIRIEGRVVPAFGGLHLAHHPRRGLAGHAGVERLPGGRMCIGQQEQQRAVVVQHLLEMRDRPRAIRAVTAEPAAELVVDAAEGHALEREVGHAERLPVAVVRVAPQAQLDVGGMRELGRLAPAAGIGIEVLSQVRHRLGDRLRVEIRGVCRQPG